MQYLTVLTSIIYAYTRVYLNLECRCRARVKTEQERDSSHAIRHFCSFTFERKRIRR